MDSFFLPGDEIFRICAAFWIFIGRGGRIIPFDAACSLANARKMCPAILCAFALQIYLVHLPKKWSRWYNTQNDAGSTAV